MKISKSKIIIYFLLFTVLAAIIIMISIESIGGCNIVIRNNTGKSIKSLEAVIVDDETVDIGLMYEGEVGANSTVKAKFDKIKIGNNSDAQVYIGVRFDEYPEKIDIIDGYVTADFNGNTDIELYEKEGNIYLKAKMATTLFGSTENTNMDEEYILYPEEADYDYADAVELERLYPEDESEE